MDTTVVAAVLLSAFIIDRLIAALMFLTSYLKLSKLTDEEAGAQRSEHGRKLVYFLLSGVLSAIALKFIPYDTINLGVISGPAKSVVMWLILVAGADRISEFIGKSGAAPIAAAPPKNEFRVTGTMTFNEDKKTA
jgi:cytochrome c oxidase assembly factor CtaG